MVRAETNRLREIGRVPWKCHIWPECTLAHCMQEDVLHTPLSEMKTHTGDRGIRTGDELRRGCQLQPGAEGKTPLPN